MNSEEVTCFHCSSVDTQGLEVCLVVQHPKCEQWKWMCRRCIHTIPRQRSKILKGRVVEHVFVELEDVQRLVWNKLL